VPETLTTDTIGIREINKNVTDMDQATQHNAAMFEETTAATQSLAQEAKNSPTRSLVLKSDNLQKCPVQELSSLPMSKRIGPK
jgi:methyl-accepting chemotaxis protein